MKFRKYGADFQYSTDSAPPTSSAMPFRATKPSRSSAVGGAGWSVRSMSMSAVPDTGTLGPAHDLAQQLLDLVLGCLRIAAGHGQAPEVGERRLETPRGSVVAWLFEEVDGADEVGVVIVAGQLALFCEGEHLVRRRREQKDLDVLGGEEVVGKLADLALRVGLRPFEEMLEPLELVEDDEVRFEAVDADLGEFAAERADDGESPPVLLGVELRAPVQLVDQLAEVRHDPRPADSGPELLRHRCVGERLGVVEASADRIPSPLVDVHSEDALQGVPLGTSAFHHWLKQPVEEGALFDASAAMALVERGARREGDEVHRLAAIGHLSG